MEGQNMAMKEADDGQARGRLETFEFFADELQNKPPRFSGGAAHRGFKE